MGRLANHLPVMPVTAIFSRHQDALNWAKEQAVMHWGPLALESSYLPFDNTRYYAHEMGADLLLQLVAFAQFIPPPELVTRKLTANSLEEACAATHSFPEKRPVNIDPGYLTLGKFVLATTKDAAHRLYLGQGIFAEVTLHYAHGAWQHFPWTYPNYQQEAYQSFLLDCRRYYREHLNPDANKTAEDG
ncbi:MAG TPA: DUF4416 family protein, partial [Oligoflexia bacterium]|nr:DUF4416 family protein [Oligoflexia bacterium]